MKRFSRRFFGAVVLCGALAVADCTHAPPNLSPVGVTAFNNNRIQHGFDLIRDTAQDANAQTPPLISTATTRKVTVWHESAIKLLHETGGLNRLTLGLDELLKDVPPTESQLLLPYVTLAKTIIAEVVK